MATDSSSAPNDQETHLRLNKPINQRPEFNSQINWQRRKERERWLTNWSHIWTKRQSPEWKPRRASVASCQRQSNCHQQAFKGFEDSLTGSQIYDNPNSINPTNLHPLLTTFYQQSSYNISQHCFQPEKAKLIKVNNLDEDRSLLVARENPIRESSQANRNQEISGQNKTAQPELQINVAPTNKKESELSQTVTSCSVSAESGTISATTFTTTSDHEEANLQTTSPVELEGSTSLDHSSLLSSSKGEGTQLPTTCCPESYSPSELTCTSIENSTPLGMNEKFQLQEKQRKFLISSMALKWMVSDCGQADECYNCRFKSFLSELPHVPRLRLKSDAKHQVENSKISANNSSSTLPDRLVASTATRLVYYPESGKKNHKSVGVNRSVEQEKMHIDVMDTQCLKVAREFKNTPEQQDFRIRETRSGSRDEESAKTMGQAGCDTNVRVLERDTGGGTSMIRRQHSLDCANCCLPTERRDFESDTESEGISERALNMRMITKRYRQESSIPREPSRKQHHKHCGSEASLEDEDSYDLESLIVESWLDDHPNFVHDHFMRKATRRMIDDWLITHAKVSNTNSGSQLDLMMSKSQQSVASHLIQSSRRGGDNSPKTQRTIVEFQTSDFSHPSSSFPATRSNSQSGYRTPVRKISATDFESRTGSAFLRPMVSTTPDGRPTFLSQEINDYIERDEGEKNHENHSVKDENSETTPRLSDNSKIGDKKIKKDTDAIGDATKSEKEEVELIFELVKNICNDLDIRTLLHTILKNIAVLINADKSSLFLVSGQPNDPNRTLVSQLFNVDQDSEVDEPEDCITIPWGTGLVGYVAESGESVNIANCYEDPRFTDTIDQRTGYVTRHMLCGPIFDKRNEIVGVAQVINKRDGNPFSESDEMKFKRYLQFCGIGLRNAQSYEHCQLENRRNQVLLDLARMVFEEQSTIEQVVYRIMLHTQSLLECQRCQVLLIDDGSDDLDQLLQLPNTTCKTGGPTANSATMSGPKPRWRPHYRATQEDEILLDRRSPSPAERYDDAASDECFSFDESAEQEAHTLSCPSQHQSSKLFSLVFDLECDGSDLVMSSSNSRKSSDKINKTRPFPINIGITGYVAMTGETLNIEDAHQCERFEPSVDEDSDFRHKSILCMPIRNGQRQIIGVSQLINKRNGRPFNKNDEDLFEAFAIFCGLGIHNTLMYERVLKIMAKQRVTFEVLSYHATAPLEEAKKLHSEPIPSCFALNLTSLKFNDFSLDEQFMLKSCLRFFIDLDLIRRFQIDQLVFCNWILSVQKNYRKVTYHPIVGGTGLKASPVRYHNWRHAFNVSQMMFAILINTQICPTLGELETLALLIACLCHDLDHRGTNNSFQIKSASPLAELYSTSTMEHHHFDQCIMILNSQGNQILANLSPDEYSRVIVLLEEAILATDLANYFQKREFFFQLVNSNQFDWHQNQEHRSLLRCMLMTACDVAAITKPWPVQKVVADLVMSEFHQQGDIEKNELNIEPIDLMNRDKMSKLPEMQIGFIDSICAPIYSAFARLFPCELSPLLDGCLSNRTLWTELAKSNNQAKPTDLQLASFLNNNNGAVLSKFLAKNSAKLTSNSSSETNLRMHSESRNIDDNRGSDFIDCIMSKSNDERSNSSHELIKVGCQRKSI